MDSEPTNGKLFTDIHNNDVPSLGLEEQHEELCSNTLRGSGVKEYGGDGRGGVCPPNMGI